MITTLLGAAIGMAQPAPAEPAETTPAVVIDAGQPVPGPPGATLDILRGGDIGLEVDEKSSELTLGYSWVGRSDRIEGTSFRLARHSFNLGLTLPVGGSDNLLDSATFDRLSDGPELNAAYTWFGTRSADRFEGPEFTRIMALAVQRCLSGEGPEPPSEGCEFHRTRPTRAFALTYSGLGEDVINRALLSPGFALGVEAGVGWNDFDYRAPGTLAEGSVNEPQFSVKVYGALMPADAMSMLLASAEYQNAFEAPDPEILCRPVVANPNDDCVRASPGPPENVERLLLGLEYRRVLGQLGRVGQLAIAPQARVDALGDEFEVSLPVYLTPRRNLGLLPGFRVTYRSEDDEIIVGLFLKQTFSFD